MEDIKNETISELREKDREHDSRLDTLSAQNQTQEFKLKSQVAKDKEHDFRLDSLANKNSSQDSEIHRQAVKDEEHDMRLDSIESRCAALENQVRFLIKLLPENVRPEMDVPVDTQAKSCALSKVLAFVALLISIASLLISILL